MSLKSFDKILKNNLAYFYRNMLNNEIWVKEFKIYQWIANAFMGHFRASCHFD